MVGESSGHRSVSLGCKKKEAYIGDIPDVLQCTTSKTSPSLVVQIGTLPQLLDQWKA